MKTLFTRFPLESAYGGAEVQTLALMKGLQARGHLISFLGSCPVLLERSRELGIKNYEVRIGKPPVTKWHALSFLWRRGAMRKKLVRALSSLQPPPNAMFLLSLSEKLLLTKEAVKQGIKVFWIEHDRVGRWLTRNPWLPELRRLSRLVTTITVSELSREMYLQLEWDPYRVVSIPNGVDLNRFSQAEKREQRVEELCPRSLHVGCVARLTRDKGVDLLIRAIADFPHVTLTIVGKGREEKRLRALSGPAVAIVPSVPEIAAFYRSLGVLVLPSREHDPFGLAAAEAMSLGTPVIVTSACGIASYLRNGIDALIVEPNSVEALRDGIRTLQNPEYRRAIALQGQAHASERFSFENMITTYERTLQ